MTEHDDNDFDDVREAYRSAGGELPDAALDQRILAAAHRAVEPAPKMRRWQPGLAVAAVVVLSATLVLTMRPPESGDSATAAPASAQRQSPEADVMAETARARDGDAAMPAAADDSELVDTIIVTGSRVSRNTDIEADEGPAAAKAEPARRERAAELAPQVGVASPVVAPDALERRAQEAEDALDAESAEEFAREAAQPSDTVLQGITRADAVAPPAAPTDVRLAPIIDSWERGDTDNALEALTELVAGDDTLTDETLKAALPEAFFTAWRERE